MLFWQTWWTFRLSTLPDSTDWWFAVEMVVLSEGSPLHRGTLTEWPFWGCKQNMFPTSERPRGVLDGMFKNMLLAEFSSWSWFILRRDLKWLCVQSSFDKSLRCRILHSRRESYAAKSMRSWVTDGLWRLFLGGPRRPPWWVPSGVGHCQVSNGWRVSAGPGWWSYWCNWLIYSFPDLSPREHISSIITSTAEQHNTTQTFQERINGQIHVW